jgi:hypothetical protein
MVSLSPFLVKRAKQAQRHWDFWVKTGLLQRKIKEWSGEAHLDPLGYILVCRQTVWLLLLLRCADLVGRQPKWLAPHYPVLHRGIVYFQVTNTLFVVAETRLGQLWIKSLCHRLDDCQKDDRLCWNGKRKYRVRSSSQWVFAPNLPGNTNKKVVNYYWLY